MQGKMQEAAPTSGAAHTQLLTSSDVETAANTDNDALVAGVYYSKDMAAGLGIRMRAIGSLSESTRRYLHINVLGQPLPTWMNWYKQPKINRYNYYMSRLHTLMTDATSGVYASWVSQFMVLSIVVSVLSFCLETIPMFSPERNPTAANVFTWVEAVTIQIFAVDYLLRLVSAPVKLKFIVEPFNIIDLIAIVPWYIITFVGANFNGTTVFRVVRLLRVFRVLKLGGRYSKLLVVLHSLGKSVDMLGLMVFFISLCIVFFATLMYYAERGTWDDDLGYYVRPHEVQTFDYDVPKPSPFESIVSGFWWAVVTLMTVGYGDTFPITAGGKVIACFTMICGILTLALPISVIGATFSSDWAAHVESEKHEHAIHKKITAATSPVLLKLQRLLNRHVEDAQTLVTLNRSSELALEEASTQLQQALKGTKKHLHTEAKADLRLRRVALRNRVNAGETPPYDQQYGYLSMEHVKERYREQLTTMSEVADALTRRAVHVTRMEGVNVHLVDPELEAIVRRLAKKHADLDFLLSKHEEKPSPLSMLEAELSDLRGYVVDCRATNAHALAAAAHKAARARDHAASVTTAAGPR